jgi:WD40 repeat protein
VRRRQRSTFTNRPQSHLPHVYRITMMNGGATLYDHARVLEGSKYRLCSCAWGPAGDWIVTAGGDYNVRLLVGCSSYL